MESKFNKFITENKWYVVFYLVWAFLHFVFFMSGNRYDDEGDFWPFADDGLDDYNLFELLVYLILPVIIFIIYKLVGKDIKKAIDDINKAIDDKN